MPKASRRCAPSSLRRTRRPLPPAAETFEPRRLLSASLVRDLNTTPEGSDPHAIVDLNGTLLVSATVSGIDEFTGSSLWKTDGTLAGTVRVGGPVNAPGMAESFVAD